MNSAKSRSTAAKTTTVLVTAVIILLAVFLIGRYGWKLGGFRSCQTAGITTVEVTEDKVKISGFCPGSLSEGFLGYHAEEAKGKLYVGFRFSALFGIFAPGNFAITIPTKAQVDEVIVKTATDEYPVWNATEGLLTQENHHGLYVRLEANDIYSVEVAYEGYSGGLSAANTSALESGGYVYLDNDISHAAKELGQPIPFTLTAKTATGTVFASAEFAFDAQLERMYLTVTADGQITDDTENHIPPVTETPTTLEAYATIIGEYYTVLAEEWDAARIMDSGLNYMVADSHHGKPLDEIGYAVTDLDADGTAELIIGSLAEDDFFGKMIFSLYTLDNTGVPMLLFESSERNRYYYAGGIKFANLGSSGWDESFVTTLKLEEREMIDMTYTTEVKDYVQMELTPFAQWVK